MSMMNIQSVSVCVCLCRFITGRRKKKELGGRGEDEEEARLPTAKRARHANQPANQFSANQQLVRIPLCPVHVCMDERVGMYVCMYVMYVGRI